MAHLDLCELLRREQIPEDPRRLCDPVGHPDDLSRRDDDVDRDVVLGELASGHVVHNLKGRKVYKGQGSSYVEGGEAGRERERSQSNANASEEGPEEAHLSIVHARYDQCLLRVQVAHQRQYAPFKLGKPLALAHTRSRGRADGA